MFTNRRGTGAIPLLPGFGTAFLPPRGTSRPPVCGMRSLSIDTGMPVSGDKRGMQDMMRGGEFGGGKGQEVIDIDGESENEAGAAPNEEEEAAMANHESGTEKGISDDEEEVNPQAKGEERGSGATKKPRPMSLKGFDNDVEAQEIIANFKLQRDAVAQEVPQPAAVDPNTPLGQAKANLEQLAAEIQPIIKKQKDLAKLVTAARDGASGYPQLQTVNSAKHDLAVAEAQNAVARAEEVPTDQTLAHKNKLFALLSKVEEARGRLAQAETAYAAIKKETSNNSKALLRMIEVLRPDYTLAKTRVKELSEVGGSTKAPGKKERLLELRIEMEEALRAHKVRKVDEKKKEKAALVEQQAQEEAQKEQEKAKENECFDLACHIHLVREEFLTFYEKKCQPVMEMLEVHGNCEGPEDAEWEIPPEDIEWFKKFIEYVQDCEKRLQQKIEEDKVEWRVERHKQVLENVCQPYSEDTDDGESASEDEEMGLDEKEGFIQHETEKLAYWEKKTNLQKGDGGNYDPSYVKLPNAPTEEADALDRRQREEAIHAVESKQFQQQMTKDMKGMLKDVLKADDFPGARPGAQDATALVKKKPK